MRIIIDTKNDVIICPKTFWDDIRKTNEVLRSVGKEPLSHREEVRKYFEKAMENDLTRAGDAKRK
jgi:hypothetical protein